MAEEQDEKVTTGDIPEGGQELPAEVGEEIQRRERAAWEKILDRVAEDPGFRQKFLDDQYEAMKELGVEDDIDAHSSISGGDAEVQGQWYSYWSTWVHRHAWGHRNIGRWVWHRHHF